MGKYEAPAEVRTLEKMIEDFSYSNGFEMSSVFDDFLQYIIYFFTPNLKPVTTWKYTKEQDAVFYQMLVEWINIMHRETGTKGWYDCFGSLYESCVASQSRKSNSGQFFTPTHICDLMVQVNCPEKNMVGKDVSDPTCGSGRILLAFNAIHPGNYLCAEDMDRTCCLMCVCNFIIHGCIGEVVWHNSLDPTSFYGAWKTNEHLTETGFPSVRSCTQQESKTWQIWENRKQTKAAPLSQPTKTYQPKQLSLFDQL
jgi:type I restriction enzyme M protein